VRDGRQTWWNLRYMAAPTVALTTAAVVLADGWLRARATLPRVAAVVVYVAIALVTVANAPVYLHRDTLEHWYRQVAGAKAHCLATHEKARAAIVYGPFTDYPSFRMVLGCHEAFG